MRRLRDVLSPSDFHHVLRIVGEPEGEILSRVDAFLRERTYVAEASVEAFQGLSPSRRERLLSDLIWWVTCYLDGSTTNMPSYDEVELEGGFRAVKGEDRGVPFFCLKKKKKEV